MNKGNSGLFTKSQRVAGFHLGKGVTLGYRGMVCLFYTFFVFIIFLYQICIQIANH